MRFYSRSRSQSHLSSHFSIIFSRFSFSCSSFSLIWRSKHDKLSLYLLRTTVNSTLNPGLGQPLISVLLDFCISN